MSRGYRDEEKAESVLVYFNHAKYETAHAHLLALEVDDDEGVWLPKSQIADIDFEKGEVWIPLWLAEKKGLSYS